MVAAQTTQCTWSTMGTTYDLSSMMVGSSSSYRVSDIRNPSTQYYFNVCGSVAPPSTTQCKTAWAAPAWQVESSPATCYRLGSFNGSLGWNFTLFDASYPARGVVLTYPGGDGTWCPGGQPRTMSLELMCALTQPSVAAYSTASVREENTCSYRVQLPSIAGCPLQCRAPGDTALCSGNGVCGYNTDAGASQCYCYAGWSGGLCASAIPSTSSLGVEGIFLIIVCVVLAGVLGLVAFMVVKLRKLAVNPAAYAELQGKYNELGQMA